MERGPLPADRRQPRLHDALALVPVFAIVVSILSAAPFFGEVMVQIKIFLLLNLTPELAGRIITVYLKEFADNAVRLTTVGVLFLGRC